LGISLNQLFKLLDEVKGVSLLSMDDPESPLSQVDTEQVVKALGNQDREDPWRFWGSMNCAAWWPRP
jgi:RNA polymerase sigma factor for flagellar operon FliA